jgi:hypothetical protein
VEAAGASWRCLGVRLVESHPRCPCRCRRIELCTGRRRLPAPQASPPRFGARERSQSKTPPRGGFPCQATHPRLPVVAAPPPVPADPWSLLQAQPFLSTHVGAVFPDELHTSEIPILSSFSFSVCCWFLSIVAHLAHLGSVLWPGRNSSACSFLRSWVKKKTPSFANGSLEADVICRLVYESWTICR